MTIANTRASLYSERTMRKHLVEIWKSMASDVGAFLRKRDRGIHLVGDGWTSPNSDSVFGVVAVYEQFTVSPA